MFLMSLLLLANGDFKLTPAEGPPLPKGYVYWCCRRDSCKDISTRTLLEPCNNKIVSTDYSLLPFLLHHSNFDSSYIRIGDSCGIAFYYSTAGIIKVKWGLPVKDSLDHNYIRIFLKCNSIKTDSEGTFLDGKGVEEITIDSLKTYRLRARWYYSECDVSYIRTGNITSYLLENENYVFLIICTNLLYWREDLPEGIHETLSREELDSLQQNWKYEQYYPDRIAELERAVEQTFRVKE